MACMNKSLYRKSMGKKKKEMDNLAKDAAAALAAGMSYGKWKAMQAYEQSKKQTTEPEPGWKVCKHCGKFFKPRSYRPQIYCDYDCQHDAARQRHNENLKAQYRERKQAEAAK